jgi:membrane protease YdiL (CAAX protease family)
LAFRWSGRIYTRHKERGDERMGVYLSAIVQTWTFLLLFTAPYWLVGALLKNEPVARQLRELYLSAPIDPHSMIYWSAGLLLAMGAVAWISSAIQDALKIPPTRLRILMQPTTTRETMTWVLLVAPTAGFCEEIVFRSMLVPFAEREIGDLWLAIAATSALFGVVHFSQGLTGILATAAMGVILAIGLVFSGSVWPSIVAHTLYNMAVPFLFRLGDDVIEGIGT